MIIDILKSNQNKEVESSIVEGYKVLVGRLVGLVCDYEFEVTPLDVKFINVCKAFTKLMLSF